MMAVFEHRRQWPKFFGILPNIFLATLLIWFPAGLARARAQSTAETLGRLEISDLYLQPSYSYRETNHAGSFALGESYVALAWRRDPVISAVVKLGSRALIGQPARFGRVTNPEQLSLIEGYGEADSLFGRLRFGLIPITFGAEGGDVERHLNFPRSQIFQTRYFVLRDYGVSYHIANEGFFTDWAIHNGEGAADLDNEIWFTARIGWQADRRFRTGLTGATGRTTVLATDPNGLGNAGLPDAWMDVSQPARFRIVNLFFEWFTRALRFETEATAGEAIQGERVIRTRGLHADLEVATGAVKWLARFDILSPRGDVSGNQITDYSFGLAWYSQYDNSVLSLIGTKRIAENLSLPDHRALVTWRITPVAGMWAGEAGF